MTRPFRATYGFDAHGQRGINLATPQNDTDFANKLWTEEQIASQSRLQGTFTPDSDGLQTPLPDLDALVPNVDVLTADYWVCDLTGRADSGPMAYIDLNADDRIVANISDGGVQTATLNPAAPAGLIPNTQYRFDPVDPLYTGRGQSLGFVLETDGAGTATTVNLVNNGFDFEVGDVLNALIPNTYVNAVSATSALTPGAFTLLPDTTYYNINVSGGTGQGIVINARTNGAGTGISDIWIINRGAGYTGGDVLTFEIEGQTVGTVNVLTVYSGTDQACQVTIDTIGTDVGWTLIRGAGLTRAQADRDYLRLDGGNEPSGDINWNNQSLKDLADPLDPQDAVNLRSLAIAAAAGYIEVNQVAHGLATGQPAYFNGTNWLGARADNEVTLAQGIVQQVDLDNFRLYKTGRFSWGGHGFTPGATLWLNPTASGWVDVKPSTGYQQAFADVLDASTLLICDHAITETSIGPSLPVAIGADASTVQFDDTASAPLIQGADVQAALDSASNSIGNNQAAIQANDVDIATNAANIQTNANNIAVLRNDVDGLLIDRALGGLVGNGAAGAVITNPGAGVWNEIQLPGLVTYGVSANVTYDVPNGRIQIDYATPPPGQVFVEGWATISIEPGANDTYFEMAFGFNGTAPTTLAAAALIRQTGSTGTLTLSGFSLFDNLDTLSVWVRADKAQDYTIYGINWNIRGGA